VNTHLLVHTESCLHKLKYYPLCISVIVPIQNANSKEFIYSYRILVGKPEGKRPLGRPRRRWVENIKMDLREIGWDRVDWVDMAQDTDQWRALLNTVLNLRVP
jgi:hypothetical protein